MWGTLFVWLKLVGYLKGLNMEFATFVIMIQRILYDIKEFCAVLAIFLAMFSHVFYLRLSQLGVDKFDFDDDGNEQPWYY